MPLLETLLLSAALLADSTAYVVMNHGRAAGEMSVVRAGDSVVVRYRHVDRNRGVRSEGHYRFASDGSVRSAEMHPVGLNDGKVADAIDRFDIVGDSIRWTAFGRAGAARRDSGYYRLRGGSPFEQALLARALLRAPSHRLRLLSEGTVRLEIAADTLVRTRTGSTHVRLAMMHAATGATPTAVWIDDKGELFASDAGWFTAIRSGAEEAIEALRARENTYRDHLAEKIATSLRPPAASAIAIVNGDLFDADRGVVRPRTTVLVKGDRIVAVGPADSVQIPSGATTIDAAGKTIIPGMWEMHGHFIIQSQTLFSPQQLAQGITTVRDMAADIDIATSHRDRAASGKILAPHTILAGFIEGPGAWAGPSAVLVRTEAEARAWVARYDSLGYKQIKLYNLVHPDLVPVIADEAHKRGMRLSGHVPRGLSTQNAVRLGYDEINHAAFLVSTFYPDSFFVPTMRAYSAVAMQVAPTFDLDAPGVSAMIDLFKQRGTVIDGTFALWLQTPGSGPPLPGLPMTESAKIAEAGNAMWTKLIKRLYDAGVPLVAGTDNLGSGTYVNELELYEKAGIPAPQVLQIATIGAARVMKYDRDYGSIAVGKVADLAIIDGKPAEHVADLRKVDRVMRAGRVYDPKAIYSTIGLTPSK